MHYYRWNIKSYQAATAHLTNEEDLAYRRLLDHYYDTEAPIPTALPPLCRRLRVGLPELETVLAEFFILTAEGWRHGYCDDEIARAIAHSEKQRANGRKGGRGRKSLNGNGYGDEKNPPLYGGEAVANPTPNHPTPNTQHPVNTSPSGEVRLEQKAARRLPQDWQPNAKALAWIASFGVTLEQASPIIHEFKFYWLGRSTRRADWSLAFMRNSKAEGSLIRLRDNANGTHQQTGKPCLAERVSTAGRDALRALDEREAAGRTVGEDGASVRPPLDGDFRRVGNV